MARIQLVTINGIQQSRFSIIINLKNVLEWGIKNIIQDRILHTAY